MANLTVSSAVDTMMQAANNAGILSAIGAAGLTANTFTASQTITAGTVATNASALSLTATWATSGSYQGAILLNITNSGSAAQTSALMDLQVGGTTVVKFTGANAANSRLYCDAYQSASGGSMYYDSAMIIRALLTFDAGGKNIAFDTTTGTKIGTATGQKIGFWNVTPVVQQVLATGAGATVDNVISLLQTLGLCKQA